MPMLTVTGFLGATDFLGAADLSASTGLPGSIALTGLIALVVAALAVAALVLLLRRRRGAAADAGRPRTVAELVRLRAEATAAAPPPAPAATVVADVPAEHPPVAVPPAEIEPVADVAEPGAVERAAEQAAVRDPAAAAPAAWYTPRETSGTTGDTPWARAARMADDDSAWIPAAESGVAPPAPEPAEPPSSVLRLVRPEGDPPVDAAPDPAPEPSPPATELTAPEPAPAVSAPCSVIGPGREPHRVRPAAGPPDVATAPGSPPRARRSPAETAAEQAAADLALLRTFGLADPSLHPDNAPVVSLVPAGRETVQVDRPGPAQPVRFRALARDGSGVAGAVVTLLDDRGRESCTATADAQGRGELQAPHPGTYVMVSTAPEHQPGAVAITVSDAAVEAEVLLARSAAVTGSVFGADGPIAGARLTLVQDGEIVDAVDSAADGTYRIGDLAAGEYGLSVAAAGCEQIAVLVDVPDGIDLEHGVELEPAGRPEQGRGAADDDRADDLMVGRR